MRHALDDAGAGVRVIAHRGASADCPENTLAAFDEALRQGCHGIELDLQLSADGIPVVYHDRTLARAGGGGGTVAGTTLAALQRLDAGRWKGDAFAGQRLPTLDEVLERYATRTTLLLEIKLRGARAWQLRLARSVAEMLARRRLERQVWLLCFDRRVLREAGRTAPALRLALNLRPRPLIDRAPHGDVSDLHALSVDVRGLTRAFATRLRPFGLPLLTFTCNNARDVERSLAAGAVGVMSDRPGWLAAYLERSAGVG